LWAALFPAGRGGLAGEVVRGAGEPAQDDFDLRGLLARDLLARGGLGHHGVNVVCHVGAFAGREASESQHQHQYRPKAVHGTLLAEICCKQHSTKLSPCQEGLFVG